MRNTPSIALVVVTEHLGSENAAYGAVQNFIDVYNDEVESITIIGPATIEIERDNIDQVPIQRKAITGILPQILDYIYYQFKIAYRLHLQQSNIVFFHIGGSMLLIPVLFCKLTGLCSVIFITGSTGQSYSAKHGRNCITQIITKIIKMIESVTCCLSDNIIKLSDNMQSPWVPDFVATNVFSENFNYIDCSKFKKKLDLSNREHHIIFIGRFESVKGVQNILKSVPLLIEAYPQMSIKLIGDGGLRNNLEDFVIQEELSEHVSFSGWVDHEEIPDHLNDGRILLMPSESEGVPKTLLEAMACGTIPVAATVGGIPDIIIEGKNGFLLPDTEPATIANVISQVLEQNNLENISNNARYSIEERHSYEAVKKKYRKILHSIDK